MSTTSPAGSRVHQLHQPLGPQLAFFAAVLLGAGVLAYSATSLSPDAAFPLLSVVLFGSAVLVALPAWRRSAPAPRAAVTYWDVAGALVLIGIFAGAMVEPDQMVRLMGDASGEPETLGHALPAAG